MNYFLDTSALAKLYHIENGSKRLENELLRYEKDLILTVSDISRIEFYSVIMKKVRIKQLKLSNAKQILELFDQDWQEFNHCITDNIVKSNAINLLLKLASQSNLGALDALQLSAALSAHQILPIDCFVTADKRLLNFAREYFNTFNPEE